MTCKHEYDLSRVLLTNPLQVRCTKCHALELYGVAKAKIEQAEAQEVSEPVYDERREFWKACAISFLTTGQVIRQADGLSSSAAVIADNMLEHFDKRFPEIKK